MENQRIGYLESIRGLAALQVVLVHFIEAFSPSLWSASTSTSSVEGFLNYFRYAWEGHGAVYIFFALSGYVLTLAFDKRSYAWPQVLAARVLRLGVPAFASVCFAAIIYLVLGLHNNEAAALIHSDFLLKYNPVISLSEIFRDGVLNSTILGYSGRTWIDYLPTLNTFLQPHAVSLNTVLWTLSIEFYGSILIFALCSLHKRNSKVAWIVFVLLGIFFVRSYFLPFLFGYLMARFAVAERKPIMPAAVAVAILFIAIYANSFSWRPFHLAVAICEQSAPVMSCMSGWHQAKVYAALAIFFLLTQIPFVRTQLSRPFFVWLGALSFPIYLVHFPILLTVSAGLTVFLSNYMSVGTATAVAVLVGIVLSFIAAIGFKRVDGFAMTVSRRVQKATIGRAGVEPTKPVT